MLFNSKLAQIVRLDYTETGLHSFDVSKIPEVVSNEVYVNLGEPSINVFCLLLMVAFGSLISMSWKLLSETTEGRNDF